MNGPYEHTNNVKLSVLWKTESVPADPDRKETETE